MKITDQSWEWIQKPVLPLELIEKAGRTCYQSQNKITPSSSERFVKMILNSGHESVIEHASATVKLITNRGVMAELTRHRPCSFCLSGDTELVAYQSKIGYTSKKWTLKQLWEWQSDVKRKGRLKLITLRSVNDNGIIVKGKIKQIIQSGIKKTYTVIFRSGRNIKSTLEHRFLTKEGWKQLSELSEGARVYANGLPAIKNEEWLRKVYIDENNTLTEVAKLAGCCVTHVTKSLRYYGINKPLSMRKNRCPGYGKKGMFSTEEKKRISIRMKGENSPNWKGNDIKPNSGRLRANKIYHPDRCWGCQCEKKIERHHIDGNPINNEKSNIIFLYQKVFLDEIISVKENMVMEPTYDVEMETEPYNFVANGIVVHNSIESTRYVNYDDDMEFIRPVWWKKWSQQEKKCWTDTMGYIESAYCFLIQAGSRPEQAREVLPNALKTTIIMTANLRECRHIFKLRTSKKAHPQIRALMSDVLAGFKKEIPVIFDGIGE